MTTAPVGCLEGELLPCPFCGAQPKVGFHGDEDGGYHYTECLSCRRPKDLEAARFIGVHAESKADAIAAWNTRSASRQEGWQPIADAPEGVLLVVGWLDPEDDEHPERHDFDYLEDGVWQKHSENVEYFQVCAPAGSRGPKEQAPYTHFMPVGSIPAAPHQAQEAQGDRHGE